MDKQGKIQGEKDGGHHREPHATIFKCVWVRYHRPVGLPAGRQ